MERLVGRFVPMKQPMAYSKGKAAQVRKIRHGASIIKSRTKVYSRMDKWEETGAGTPAYSIKVTLHDGWSFAEDSFVPVKSFPSVALAMRGLSMTYIPTAEMIFRAKKTKTDRPAGDGSVNWQERLTALSSIAND